LLLNQPGERSIRLARNAGETGHPPPGGVTEQERQRRREQSQSGQPGVEQDHRNDQRDGEQHRVPRLDDEFAHPDAEHLDIADHARHQVSDRDAVQLRQRCGEYAAHHIGADVGTDAGVAGHQPPALENTRAFGEERAADERKCRPGQRLSADLTIPERERGVDCAAKQKRRQHHRGIHGDTGQ
jgi:hypothetical protein